nr:putative uncharacterized transmembrane protein DDB_G0290641 [Ipomoea batatas]
MMNDGNVIDVSGFFVFEATGDSSEVQSSVLNEDYSADHEWGDDDAQSCSGRDFGEVDDADEVKRVSRCLSFEENYEYGDDDICDAAGGGNETEEDDDSDEDEEEEEVNQGWIMRVKRSKKLMRPLGVVRTTTRIKSKKSKVCNLEMMSEKDRDRLFWEACLSSS